MQPSPVSTGFPDFASVVSQTSASVVSVVNVRPQPPSQLIDATEPSTEASAQQAPQSHARWVGIGSGFAVGTHEILTSAHVLEGAQSLEIVLGDDSRYRATVIATEPRVDLALLSMQGDAQHPAPPLTPLVFSAETPAIGSWALSVGHPHGLGYTVTAGIISGKGRDYDDLGRPVGLAESGCWSFLQTDASINVGNSGGPLLNLRAEVVGITTAVRRDAQGLAFSVPAELATKFITEVHRYGQLRRPYLGMQVAQEGPDSYPARMHNLVVRSVVADGPASQAGLLAGDIIANINGRPVTRLSGLSYLAQLYGVDAALDVEVLRQTQAAPQLARQPIHLQLTIAGTN